MIQAHMTDTFRLRSRRLDQRVPDPTGHPGLGSGPGWPGLAIMALLWVPGPALAQAPVVQPCASKLVLRPAPGTEPQAVPANRAGCTQGYRIEARPGLAFWRCDDAGAGTMRADTAAAAAVLVEQDGRIVRHVDDEAQGGGLASWMVVGADLDGSGQRSWAVTTWTGQSQGIGVHSWSMSISDPSGRPVTSRTDIADWSPDLVVQAVGQQRGCAIGTSAYVSGRGGQTLWRVSFSRIVGGRWVAEPGRPDFERRYTQAFQRQRTAWFERPGFQTEGDPITWLAGASAVRR
jgi:hypothetical protein